MENLSTNKTSHNVSCFSTQNFSKQCKKLGFALTVIFCVGSLIAISLGLAGYFQVGPLRDLKQLHTIIITAAGGGGGILFLALSIFFIKRAGETRKNETEEKIKSEAHFLPSSRTTSVRLPHTEKAEFIKNCSVGELRGGKHFGKNEWQTYFGDVGDEPPISEDLENLLNSPCPYSGDETIKRKDTQMLVLIPATIDGKPFTLNIMEELIKDPKNEGKRSELIGYDPKLKSSFGEQAVSQSYWVLMTRDVIPGSKNKTFEEQKKLIQEREDEGYRLPKVIEAAVCILAEHVCCGKKLFSSNPMTYTRCQEMIENQTIIVGGYSAFGLNLERCNEFGSVFYGTAAVKEVYPKGL